MFSESICTCWARLHHPELILWTNLLYLEERGDAADRHKKEVATRLSAQSFPSFGSGGCCLLRPHCATSSPFPLKSFCCSLPFLPPCAEIETKVLAKLWEFGNISLQNAFDAALAPGGRGRCVQKRCSAFLSFSQTCKGLGVAALFPHHPPLILSLRFVSQL